MTNTRQYLDKSQLMSPDRLRELTRDLRRLVAQLPQHEMETELYLRAEYVMLAVAAETDKLLDRVDELLDRLDPRNLRDP